MKLAIYLSGSIQKGNSTGAYWTDKEIDAIRNALPACEISFLNPAIRSDDISDPKSVFGRDMLQVYCSSVVFVDAREKRGLGIGAEMMYAKLHRIPVISWAPKNTHYHKSDTTVLGTPISNFIHPFIFGLSDAIVETVEEGAEWIENYLSNPAMPIKGIDSICFAMEHYKETQFPNDTPMKELLSSNEELQEIFGI